MLLGMGLLVDLQIQSDGKRGRRCACTGKPFLREYHEKYFGLRAFPEIIVRVHARSHAYNGLCR